MKFKKPSKSHMDFRFSKFEILTGSGTLIVCLFFISVFSEVSAIENQLGAQVKESVQTDDLYWSSVEVSGQSVTLTGSAPDVPAKNAAERKALAVFGVTSVSNEIKVIGEAGTCQKQLNDYLLKERVTFKTGRADISDSSVQAIGMLAMIVRSCEANLEIAGHTDDQGDAMINLKLSQRRADSVARELVRHGVDPQRLRAVGYGEVQPVADNEIESGRKANRRIEFRVLGGTV
jgi:outer membrane protein OmpA-like peptidoglycan-associated protein